MHRNKPNITYLLTYQSVPQKVLLKTTKLQVFVEYSCRGFCSHCSDVIMSTMASQITGISIA